MTSQAQTFTDLDNFTGSDDGETPVGSVIQATDGNFYGTTAQGGAHYYGSVFRITPAGKMTTLYGFGAERNCTEGPSGGLVQGQAGNSMAPHPWAASGQCGFLGMGCGIVFKMDRKGKETVLHSFTGLDGDSPNGVIRDANGNLYGTTYGAAAGNAISGAVERCSGWT